MTACSSSGRPPRRSAATSWRSTSSSAPGARLSLGSVAATMAWPSPRGDASSQRVRATVGARRAAAVGARAARARGRLPAPHDDVGDAGRRRRGLDRRGGRARPPRRAVRRPDDVVARGARRAAGRPPRRAPRSRCAGVGERGGDGRAPPPAGRGRGRRAGARRGADRDARRGGRRAAGGAGRVGRPGDGDRPRRAARPAVRLEGTSCWRVHRRAVDAGERRHPSAVDVELPVAARRTDELARAAPRPTPRSGRLHR